MATYQIGITFFLDCDEPSELGEKIYKLIESSRNGDLSRFNGWAITNTERVA